jgi:hypothetical protein
MPLVLRHRPSLWITQENGSHPTTWAQSGLVGIYPILTLKWNFHLLEYHMRIGFGFYEKEFIPYHSRFISEVVAELSQIFEEGVLYLNYLAVRNTTDVTGGKPIAV